MLELDNIIAIKSETMPRFSLSKKNGILLFKNVKKICSAELNHSPENFPL